MGQSYTGLCRLSLAVSSACLYACLSIARVSVHPFHSTFSILFIIHRNELAYWIMDISKMHENEHIPIFFYIEKHRENTKVYHIKNPEMHLALHTACAQ